MIVRVQTNPTRITKEEVAYATEWMGNYFLGKRLANKIDITIVPLPGNPSLRYYGVADTDAHGRSPRSFIFRINRKISRERYLDTIAHEMVHVNQMARNYLRFYPVVFQFGIDEHLMIEERRDVRWRGVDYDSDTLGYMNSPWEEEAFTNEPIIKAAYANHLRNQD